jgi:tetratricopeptide (TPR) repeat protein
VLWDLARGAPAVASARLTRAAHDLERAAALRPEWALPWADLGWIRFGLGDRAGAAQAFGRAVEVAPAHAAVGLARADFLWQAGELDLALGELRRVRLHNRDVSLASVVARARGWTSDFRKLELLCLTADETRELGSMLK